MEFGEKLQALRRGREMMQEELAHALYVSRTAISNWESGRGYPNIDSLKAISKYFAVSIDELLSGDALLSIAEDESREREARLRSLTFGLLDCAAAMLLFLPFFADRTGGAVRASALLSLSGAAPYVRAAYLFIVSVTVIWGVLTLSLQNCRTPVWLKCCGRVSAGLSAVDGGSMPRGCARHRAGRLLRGPRRDERLGARPHGRAHGALYAYGLAGPCAAALRAGLNKLLCRV